MKYGYKNPKENDAPRNEEMLRECSRQNRKYLNLEDGIRRDRRQIESLNAQIRRIERQIDDIRAKDNDPDIITPGFSLSRENKPRFSFNPWSWAAQQAAEIIEATAAQSNARERIGRLQAEKRDLQYERDRLAQLKSDSETAKSEILADMRRLGCPAAGSTNY